MPSRLPISRRPTSEKPGLDQRSLTSLRWAARVPRILFMAALAVVMAAGVGAILRNAAPIPASTRSVATRDQRPVEAFAEAFARAYLTWDADRPDEHQRSLAPYVPRELDQDGGVELPRAGRQAVLWTAIAGDAPSTGGRLVTVAAQTTHGPLRLAIEVARDRRGFLSIAGYPAVVGPPPVAHSVGVELSSPIEDSGLTATLARALRNYLAGNRDELAADVAPGALVALPEAPVELTRVDETSWVEPSRRAAVVLRATRPDGSVLTLRYVVGVVRRAGRWFLQSIETNALTRGVSP